MRFKTIEELLKYIILNPKPHNSENWEKVFREMAVHSRMLPPTDLLLSRRPNEEEEIYKYRLDNYEAITYGSMNRALDNLYRIFNSINYSIQCNDQLKEYLASQEFDNLTFKSYMETNVLKRMIEDPNGLLVWYPSGEGLKDGSIKVDVKPILVECDDIMYIDSDYCCFESEEHNYYILDGKEYEGEVYWAFDRENFYKFIQVSKSDYAIEIVYSHNLGITPCLVLGGNINANGYFDSFFSPYLAFGNEAIRQFSDWQAIMVTSGFPYREELATDCTNPSCYGGKDKTTKETCGVCKGTTKVISKSPFGVYVRKLPAALSESKDNFSIPSLRFISPDVNVLKYSGESWEKLIELAEKELHLNNMDVSQSGVAKDIDREELFAMLNKIGNYYFDNLMTPSLEIIEAYRNIAQETEVFVIKPSDFRIKSEIDLINEITTLTEKKAPTMFISEAVRQLTKKRYAGNILSEKIMDLIMYWDLLSVYNMEEKTQLKLSGAVSNEIYTKSIYAYQLVLQLVNEITQEQFMKKSFEELSAKLNEMIKPYYQQKDVSLFDPNGNAV